MPTFKDNSPYGQVMSIYHLLQNIGNEGFYREYNVRERNSLNKLLRIITAIFENELSVAPYVEFQCFNALLSLLVFGDSTAQTKARSLIEHYENPNNALFFSYQLAERIKGFSFPKAGTVVSNQKCNGQCPKATNQTPMKGRPSFIVSVKCKTDAPVEYLLDGVSKTLKPGEVFTGYFWQEHVRLADDTFRDAHVRETIITDDIEQHFRYGGDAIFPNNEIQIEIRALRGPDSRNQFLSKEYQHFETWYEDPESN